MNPIPVGDDAGRPATTNNDLEVRLRAALSTIEELRQENARLRTMAVAVPAPPSALQLPAPQPRPTAAPVTAHSSDRDKITLFRSL